MENERATLKDILKEIVTDLEEIRAILAGLQGVQSAESKDRSRTVSEIAAGANRAAYNSLRKRIDALRAEQ